MNEAGRQAVWKEKKNDEPSLYAGKIKGLRSEC